MRIGIARLWHEANAFSPAITRQEQFAAREWVRGTAARSLYQGTATEIGGALEWRRRRPDVEFVFSRCASAAPAGPIEQALLDDYTAEVAGDPALEGIDGLYLSLHGASIGTADLAPEESLLNALRRRFPDLPIAASFDLHACLSPAIAAKLDVATVYRTYPHVDMAQAASGALDMLAKVVGEGKRTRVIVRQIDRILPSFNMRTDRPGPMGEVEEIALRTQENLANGRILAAYPFASFAYADVPAANSGVVVTCEDEAMGNRLADTVAAALFERRQAFIPDLAPAEAVLASRPWANGRRVAILEPSDNPLSGGLGDTPGLFSAAMAADLPEGSLFAFFCDPALVAKAHTAGTGASLEISLGGRLDPRFGEPVSCGATILRLTDGSFGNAGPMEQGMRVNLGRTALLRVGRLRVIVTEGCQSPNDRNYFALHGIDIETVPVLLAKAKNHFMAAFGGIFDEVMQCDTPGPAMADVSRLPFRHIPATFFEVER